jgi:hypothetical protein
MFRRVSSYLLALSLASLSGAAAAKERSFAYTRESSVLPAGQSELEPWTTFRVGRERYYSALDARLALAHGLASHLQLALYWNAQARTQDVVQDELTGELARVSASELDSASLELAYQLTDSTADALGSALYLETTLGPRHSQLVARLVLDHSLGAWLFAGNLGAHYELEPVRGHDGSELETAFVLEPRLGARYALPGGFRVGLELRAPLALSGHTEGATLFGGPALGWAGHRFWAVVGVEPQLVAFTDESPGSRLDLEQHERLEVRVLAGFVL